MIIEIRGHALPGRRCGPSPEGGDYGNIHVGLARQNDTIDLVPGDAESVSWELEVKVASLGLADERGWPRCASVRPPMVTWSVS